MSWIGQTVTFFLKYRVFSEPTVETVQVRPALHVTIYLSDRSAQIKITMQLHRSDVPMSQMFLLIKKKQV